MTAALEGLPGTPSWSAAMPVATTSPAATLMEAGKVAGNPRRPQAPNNVGDGMHPPHGGWSGRG